MAVAESVAVLAPLGAALPDVLRERHPGVDTDTALDLLVIAGVLHRGRRGRSWRFVIPALAEALATAVDPFRGCELAAAAVTAVWAGRTGLDVNSPVVAGWIADAHGLLDPVRSRELLRAQAQRALAERRDIAVRYWDALTELAADKAERGEASALAILACYAAADYHEVVGRARLFLDDEHDTVPFALLAQLVGSVVTALQNVGEVDELTRIADRPPGADLYSICGAQYQAMANAMLGRWRRLRAVMVDESAKPAQPAAWELLAAIADMTRGDLARLHALTADAAQWEPGKPEIRWMGDATVALTLALGDYQETEELLARTGFPLTGLTSFNRANVRMLRGQGTESIEQARLAVATAVGQGFDLGHTIAVHTLTLLLAAQGRLSGARELLERAYATNPMLDHFLDVSLALTSALLGDTASAAATLSATIERASEQELVVGTELVLLMLVELAVLRGDHREATRLRSELLAVADVLRTSRARLCAGLAKARIDADTRAAQECLRIARERAVPFEHAVVTVFLAAAGLADPRLVTEAYEIFGRLDALLCRAWARTVMTNTGVSVPGRRTSLDENERLLAQLVAQGLTSRQIAGLLGTSVKGVEGRLGRLFARSGYRSRAEIAAAVSDGAQVVPVR